MPKSIKFVALWSVSVLAALALSWAAVSQVRNRVIQPVTVIQTTIAAIDVEATQPTLVVVTPQSAPEPVDPSPSAADVTASTAPGGTSVTTRSPSSSPSTSTTTAPPQTTVTTALAPQTTTTIAASALARSSYSVAGGSVTIESAPGEVYFVSAIPQPGFTTELRDVGPERVRVRFASATSVSEFEAKWDDGELDISTDEHSP
jgi:uncharacterized membrane protein